MSRHPSRTTTTIAPSVRAEVAVVLAEWERGRLSRRSVLRRAAALGISGAALAML
ncbi:MAG: hypothetical protein H0U10_07245, partial [Chloroflexia bacterium]|nr:hypothetical protein [Chloroflexia bacterium]